MDEKGWSLCEAIASLSTCHLGLLPWMAVLLIICLVNLVKEGI